MVGRVAVLSQMQAPHDVISGKNFYKAGEFRSKAGYALKGGWEGRFHLLQNIGGPCPGDSLTLRGRPKVVCVYHFLQEPGPFVEFPIRSHGCWEKSFHLMTVLGIRSTKF